MKTRNIQTYIEEKVKRIKMCEFRRRRRTTTTKNKEIKIDYFYMV